MVRSSCATPLASSASSDRRGASPLRGTPFRSSSKPFSAIGVPALVYPAKGYSATIDVGDHRGAPSVSLTDLAHQIVISRLGAAIVCIGLTVLGLILNVVTGYFGMNLIAEAEQPLVTKLLFFVLVLVPVV